MRKRRLAGWILLFSLFLIFGVLAGPGPSPASAQDASPTATASLVIPELPTVGPVSVTYPIHGQTLRGTVEITGSIALEGWTSFELAFSDAESSDNFINWFVFATGTNPVPEGPLAAWDTTLLTDGTYNLRLTVLGATGGQDVFIYGLRARNYTIDTPLPTLTLTPTPTPSASPTPTITPTFTLQPTSTPYLTPTPLPPNPAILRPGEIVFNLARGALFAGMLFGVFGLFLYMRRRSS